MATPHPSTASWGFHSLGLPPVSLRFGHATALTVHRTVIHYRSAASLPTGEGLAKIQALSYSLKESKRLCFLPSNSWKIQLNQPSPVGEGGPRKWWMRSWSCHESSATAAVNWGFAMSRIQTNKKRRVSYVKGFPLGGSCRGTRLMRGRMQSIRVLNLEKIKNNAACDGYPSSVNLTVATFPLPSTASLRMTRGKNHC